MKILFTISTILVYDIIYIIYNYIKWKRVLGRRAYNIFDYISYLSDSDNGEYDVMMFMVVVDIAVIIFNIIL